MNLRQTTVGLMGSIAVLLLLGSTARVQARSELVNSSAAKPTIVLRTSDLRSAYLIRSGQVRYDEKDMSPAGLRRQLQRHFDTVAALLLLATEHSIDVALDRLEASLQESWTAQERATWRQRLLINRRMQVARLMEYRNRGLFPQNEGHSAAPVPIFVDDHDTACAVGHLMRLSGRVQQVAGIQHKNNQIYVSNVTVGPVVSWILTSGLTLEEAALIQPSYGPVRQPIPLDAAEVLNDAQAFVFDTLRFSNFKTFPVEEGVDVPHVNIPVSHQFCGMLSCTEVIQYTPGPGIVFPQVNDEYSRVVIQFDVEVTLPNLRIVYRPYAASLMTDRYFHGSELNLFASGDRERLWIDYSPRQMSPIWGPYGPIFPILPIVELSEDFPPTDRLTIVTEMLFREGQLHQAQYVNFDLMAVPEPATAALTLCAFGWIGMVRLNRRC